MRRYEPTTEQKDLMARARVLAIELAARRAEPKAAAHQPLAAE